MPTETELAEQFAVNRSTVREALRRLESSGLVGREGGAKRLKVTRPDQAETASRVGRALALDDVTFIELWEAMLAVAPRVSALTAERGKAADVAALEAIVMAVETARSADGAVAHVVEFFGKLAELSGNRVLQLAMQPVTRLLAPSLRRMIDRVPQGRTRILVAQRCIVEAIREAQARRGRVVDDPARAGFPSRLRTGRHRIRYAGGHDPDGRLTDRAFPCGYKSGASGRGGRDTASVPG